MSSVALASLTSSLGPREVVCIKQGRAACIQTLVILLRSLVVADRRNQHLLSERGNELVRETRTDQGRQAGALPCQSGWVPS